MRDLTGQMRTRERRALHLRADTEVNLRFAIDIAIALPLLMALNWRARDRFVDEWDAIGNMVGIATRGVCR